MKVIDRVGMDKTNKVNRIGALEKNLKETESRAAVAVATAAAILPIQININDRALRFVCLFP